MTRDKDRPADLVLTGGRVLSVDHRGYEVGPAGATAVAVREGVFVAVGNDDHVEGWVGPSTEVRRLNGHTITPGLFDSHNHMLKTALGARMPSLVGARNIGDVLEVVASTRAANGPDCWVECSSRWHESSLREQRMPRSTELDSASAGAAVFLRRGGHNAVLNSRALAEFGIVDGASAPAGATIAVDADGRPTGHIVGAPFINALAQRLPAPSAETKVAALLAMADEYLRLGLTSIIEPGLSAGDLSLLASLADDGRLPQRVHAMWRLAYQGEPLDTVLSAIENEDVRQRRDDFFSIFGIKLSMDGGAETGFYREPYLRPDDPCCPHGKPLLDSDELEAIGTAAATRGWHLGVHCVGDAAVDAVLAAFARIDSTVPLGRLRWSLIHMLNPRPEHWPEVERLGLTITAQQGLAHALSDGFAQYLGEERADDIAPLAEYLRRSPLPVGGGSDSPVATWDPWVGIASSVSRVNANGRVRGRHHAITARAALGMYTSGSAYCGFQEHRVGRIRDGMLADLLVLERGAFVDPASAIPTAPLATILGGKVVHDVL